MNILKSKTFWGAVIVAAAHVVQDPSLLGIVQAIGGVLAAAGVRQAISKNGTGQ